VAAEDIVRGKSESIPGIFHVINSCGAQELIIKSVTIRDFWCDFSESCRLMATHCILADIDVVISAVGPGAQLDQIPLADAAKKAGVKRFVPCAFMTVCPPGGVMWIRDQVCSSFKSYQMS
jgi:hypothetical protein